MIRKERKKENKQDDLIQHKTQEYTLESPEPSKHITLTVKKVAIYSIITKQNAINLLKKNINNKDNYLTIKYCEIVINRIPSSSACVGPLLNVGVLQFCPLISKLRCCKLLFSCYEYGVVYPSFLGTSHASRCLGIWVSTLRLFVATYFCPTCPTQRHSILVS